MGKNRLILTRPVSPLLLEAIKQNQVRYVTENNRLMKIGLADAGLDADDGWMINLGTGTWFQHAKEEKSSSTHKDRAKNHTKQVTSATQKARKSSANGTKR